MQYNESKRCWEGNEDTLRGFDQVSTILLQPATKPTDVSTSPINSSLVSLNNFREHSTPFAPSRAAVFNVPSTPRIPRALSEMASPHVDTNARLPNQRMPIHVNRILEINNDVEARESEAKMKAIVNENVKRKALDQAFIVPQSMPQRMAIAIPKRSEVEIFTANDSVSFDNTPVLPVALSGTSTFTSSMPSVTTASIISSTTSSVIVNNYQVSSAVKRISSSRLVNIQPSTNSNVIQIVKNSTDHLVDSESSIQVHQTSGTFGQTLACFQQVLTRLHPVLQTWSTLKLLNLSHQQLEELPSIASAWLPSLEELIL